MKKIRISLIIIIILLILSIVGLLNYEKRQKIRNSEVYNSEGMEQLLQDQIYPNNFSEFHFNYAGKVNKNDVYRKLYNVLVENIPILYSKIDELNEDKKIEEYYKSQDNIAETLGITTENDFRNLISILCKINTNKLEYSQCEIEKESTKKYTDRTEFNLIIQYKNIEEIKFRVVVYNAKTSNNSIRIIPITEE